LILIIIFGINFCFSDLNDPPVIFADDFNGRSFLGSNYSIYYPNLNPSTFPLTDGQMCYFYNGNYAPMGFHKIIDFGCNVDHIVIETEVIVLNSSRDQHELDIVDSYQNQIDSELGRSTTIQSDVSLVVAEKITSGFITNQTTTNLLYADDLKANFTYIRRLDFYLVSNTVRFVFSEKSTGIVISNLTLPIFDSFANESNIFDVIMVIGNECLDNLVIMSDGVGNAPCADLTTNPLTTSPLTTSPLTSDSITSASMTSDPLTSGGLTSNPLTSSPITSKPLTSSPITSNSLTSSQVTSFPLTTRQVPLTSSPITSKPLTSSQVYDYGLTTYHLTTSQNQITTNEVKVTTIATLVGSSIKVTASFLLILLTTFFVI